MHFLGILWGSSHMHGSQNFAPINHFLFHFFSWTFWSSLVLWQRAVMGTAIFFFSQLITLELQLEMQFFGGGPCHSGLLLKACLLPCLPNASLGWWMMAGYLRGLGRVFGPRPIWAACSTCCVLQSWAQLWVCLAPGDWGGLYTFLCLMCLQTFGLALLTMLWCNTSFWMVTQVW